MEVKEVVTTSKLVEKVIARVKKMEQYMDEVSDLKRGVLSENMLYNLLCDVKMQ